MKHKLTVIWATFLGGGFKELLNPPKFRLLYKIVEINKKYFVIELSNENYSKWNITNHNKLKKVIHEGKTGQIDWHTRINGVHTIEFACRTNAIKSIREYLQMKIQEKQKCKIINEALKRNSIR